MRHSGRSGLEHRERVGGETPGVDGLWDESAAEHRSGAHRSAS